MAPGTPYPNLLSPLQVGDLQLKNRVIMASLTRNRDNIPRENLHVPYYAERAGTGLIVSVAAGLATARLIGFRSQKQR